MVVKIDLLVHFLGVISANKPNIQHHILGIKRNLLCFFPQFFRLAQARNFRKKNGKFHETPKFDFKHSANVVLKLRTPLIAHSNLECLLKCDRHYRSCSRLFCQYIYSFYRPLAQYIDQDSKILANCQLWYFDSFLDDLDRNPVNKD